MGNSAEILSGSVRTLNQDERLRVLKKSFLYKTKPWGLTEQAVFLNAVIEVSWTGEPEELMEFLLQVEKSFGRIRIRHWGPRTLDLDMIYNSEIESNTDFLKLPHPFFWERPFVLVPLEEIYPDFVFNGEGIHQRILELDGYKDVEKTDIAW